jgi:hypothetical protein
VLTLFRCTVLLLAPGPALLLAVFLLHTSESAGIVVAVAAAAVAAAAAAGVALLLPAAAAAAAGAVLVLATAMSLLGDAPTGESLVTEGGVSPVSLADSESAAAATAVAAAGTGSDTSLLLAVPAATVVLAVARGTVIGAGGIVGGMFCSVAHSTSPAPVGCCCWCCCVWLLTTSSLSSVLCVMSTFSSLLVAVIGAVAPVVSAAVAWQSLLFSAMTALTMASSPCGSRVVFTCIASYNDVVSIRMFEYIV